MGVFVIRDEFDDGLREERSFDEPHPLLIRQWRTGVNGDGSAQPWSSAASEASRLQRRVRPPGALRMPPLRTPGNLPATLLSRMEPLEIDMVNVDTAKPLCLSPRLSFSSFNCGQECLYGEALAFGRLM